MFSTRVLVTCAVYGFAWKIAVFHSFWGFLFLLVAGFFVGFILYFKDHFIQGLISAFVAGALGMISAIPLIGPLLVSVILIYFTIKKIKLLLLNLPLMIAGIVLYYLLFHAPLYLHHLFLGENSEDGSGFLDFIFGTAALFFATFVLTKLGYQPTKIFIFTIGLPAFLFMFKYAHDHSPFNDYSD